MTWLRCNVFALITLVFVSPVISPQASAQDRPPAIFAYQTHETARVEIDVQHASVNANHVRNQIRLMVNRTTNRGLRFDFGELTPNTIGCGCIDRITGRLSGVEFAGGFHTGPSGIYTVRLRWTLVADNNPREGSDLSFDIQANSLLATGTVEVDVFYDVIRFSRGAISGGTTVFVQGDLRGFDQNALNRRSFANVVGRFP